MVQWCSMKMWVLFSPLFGLHYNYSYTQLLRSSKIHERRKKVKMTFLLLLLTAATSVVQPTHCEHAPLVSCASTETCPWAQQSEGQYNFCKERHGTNSWIFNWLCQSWGILVLNWPQKMFFFRSFHLNKYKLSLQIH